MVMLQQQITLIHLNYSIKTVSIKLCNLKSTDRVRHLSTQSTTDSETMEIGSNFHRCLAYTMGLSIFKESLYKGRLLKRDIRAE